MMMLNAGIAALAVLSVSQEADDQFRDTDLATSYKVDARCPLATRVALDHYFALPGKAGETLQVFYEQFPVIECALREERAFVSFDHGTRHLLGGVVRYQISLETFEVATFAVDR